MASATESDSTMLPGIYVPLEDPATHIRLLRLTTCPSDTAEFKMHETDWHMHEVAFSEAPPYITLSYVWGREQDRVQVKLAGRRCWIPKALHTALEAVATLLTQGYWKLPKVSYVWADAICINQEDNAEKTTQVANMFNIYHHATATVAWLGSNTQGVEEVFAGLTNLAEITISSEETHGKPVPQSSLSLTNKRLQEALLDFLSNHFLTSALRAIMEHPLWTRIWILQETVAPKDILYICGSSTSSVLGWKAFFNILNAGLKLTLETAKLSASTDRGAASYWSNLTVAPRRLLQERAATQAGTKWSLVALLRKSRSLFNASDPRDLVYALVPISKDQPISPDYSCDYQAVCLRIACHILNSAGSKAVLQEAERNRKDPDDRRKALEVSSWIPDWRRPRSNVSTLDKPPRSIDYLSPSMWVNMLGDAKLERGHYAYAIRRRQDERLQFIRHAYHDWYDTHAYREGDQLVAFEDHFSNGTFGLLRPDDDGHFWFLHLLRPSNWPPENACLARHLCSRNFECKEEPCLSVGWFTTDWCTVRLH